MTTTTNIPRIVISKDDYPNDCFEQAARAAMVHGWFCWQECWHVKHPQVEIDVTDCDDHLPPATQDRQCLVHTRDDGGVDDVWVTLKMSSAYRDHEGRLIFIYDVEAKH